MLPKPRHLSAEYAATFKSEVVADVYHHRPPYPPALFDALVGLMPGSSGPDGARAVLDVGCGTGDLARGLVDRVSRVDAVDFSAAMIRRGRDLPNGHHPRLRWIHGSAEDALLDPPYGLITAGDSLHWLAWDVVLPRFAAALAPGGYLAIVSRDWGTRAPEERAIFARYSVNRDYRPFDLVDELSTRRLFRVVGRASWHDIPWRPTIDEYVACRHSQNGFPRDVMGLAAASAFDRALVDLLVSLHRQARVAMIDDRLDLTMEASVVWGVPLA